MERLFDRHRSTFEIHTDHKNLQYFQQPQDIGRQQAQWITQLHIITLHFTTNQEQLTLRLAFCHGCQTLTKGRTTTKTPFYCHQIIFTPYKFDFTMLKEFSKFPPFYNLAQFLFKVVGVNGTCSSWVAVVGMRHGRIAKTNRSERCRHMLTVILWVQRGCE